MKKLVCFVELTCKYVVLFSQCAYSIGRALLLVSEHTSPDSPCQWWEGHSTGKITHTSSSEGSVVTGSGETEREGGARGGTAVELNRHSTLSLVMKREEASQAEVNSVWPIP